MTKQQTLFARWIWDGTVLGNLSMFPESVWTNIGSNNYSYKIQSDLIQVKATSDDYGSDSYIYTAIDLTYCTTLHVYGSMTKLGTYNCRGDIYFSTTIPNTNAENLSDTWMSGTDYSSGWRTIDVSNLTGIYYLVIAKEHYDGYLDITALYFDMSYPIISDTLN